MGHDSAKLGQDDVKMLSGGRVLEWRKMGQVGPKMGHDSAKMTMLGSVWELLGGSWEHFS